MIQRCSSLILVVGLVIASRATAQPAQRMTFRNNLLPGHMTTHRITRTIYRTAQRKKHVEKFTYRQEARWVQCNIDEPKPGSTMIYQMIVDGPAKAVSLRRGKKKVKPIPKAAKFVLPGKSTRLRSAHKSPHEAPAQIPLTDSAQRAVLHAMLDVAHWPKKRINAGHRWQRDLSGNGISGTQTFEFIDLAKEDGDAVARLTLYVEGEFEGLLADGYVFDKGQAVFYWSRPDRVLLRMEAQAFYRRRRPNAPEEFKVKIDVALTGLDILKDAEQERIKEQMEDLDSALKAHRSGNDRVARDLCRQFRNKWPGVLWMPALEELENRVALEDTSVKRLSARKLDDLLAKTIIKLQVAESSYEYDVLAFARSNLGTIASTHRSMLKKFAKGKDAGARGRALFALAFSNRPGDFTTVQKAARDKSSKVRVLVLAALAARRNPQTSADLLILMLDDKKAAVRRHACRAIAACVSPEQFAAVMAAEKLGQVMIHDEDDDARLCAVRALAVVGAMADIPKLEKALTHELNPVIREEIHKAIETLSEKNG